VLVARTRWSSAGAAGDFCEDYRTILKKRWPGVAGETDGTTSAESKADHAGSGPEVLLRTTGPRQAFLLHEGDECRWAEGVPHDKGGEIEKWLADLP
jgi:hypothetical protein